MMEAIGGDLLDYARASQMDALCQYLEQLSARIAADVLPLAQPSCVQADVHTADNSSLVQPLQTLQLLSKQQQQQQQQQKQTGCERWGGRSGIAPSGAAEARLQARTSDGEACRCAGAGTFLWRLV